MGTKLYVGNLSYNTAAQDLKILFEEAGAVSTCELVTDRDTGRSRGFAFVEMASQEDADKAVQQCNGKEVDGRALVVNEARPREERGRGGFSGGGTRPRAYSKPGSGKGSRRGIRNAKRGGRGYW